MASASRSRIRFAIGDNAEAAFTESPSVDPELVEGCRGGDDDVE